MSGMSIAMPLSRLLCRRLDRLLEPGNAREDRPRLGQFDLGCEPCRKVGEFAPVGATARRSRSLAATLRHIRLHQNADLAQDLGSDMEHGRHARRIAAPQRPGLLGGEIAVGVGNDLPDGIERAVDRLHLMLRAHFREQRIGCRQQARGRRR